MTYRLRTQLQRRRGLKQNGPVRGEKAKTYVDISRRLDEAMGNFGQIPSGRPNGFPLGPKAACKGTQPSRRVFRRSEERSVGTECVSKCRSWGSWYQETNKRV